MDNTKTFFELCDIISNARKCVSIEFNSQEYILKQKICKVLTFLNIDAKVFTRDNILLFEKDKVSNVIICHDENHCLFINNKLHYIIYYSPNSQTPNLLVQRFISIYYKKYQLISLFDDNIINTECKIDHWILCILFSVITYIHKDYDSTDILQALSQEYNNSEFLLDFQDLCNVVSSNQTLIHKSDISRPRVFYTKLQTTSHAQNMNKVLEILHDIVTWCCMTIKNDETVRNDKLYCKLISSGEFNRLKKHIKISKAIVYESIIKLWNRMNYELTLNNNNIQVVKQSFQNIVHSWSVHYKYLIFVFINLVQSNNSVDNIVNKYSFTIVSLTEEYDEKLREITILADSMNDLMNEVLKY